MKDYVVTLPYRIGRKLWFVSKYDDGIYKVDGLTTWCYKVCSPTDIRIELLYENGEYIIGVDVFPNYAEAKAIAISRNNERIAMLQKYNQIAISEKK